MNQADFNLLVGILAIRNGFIDPPALIEAFHDWKREQRRPLAEILEDRGYLSVARRALLLALAEEYVRGHGGDPSQSLAALRSDVGARRALQKIDDEALQASLKRVGTGPLRDDGTSTPPFSEEAGDPSAIANKNDGSGSYGRFRVLRPHAKGGLGAVAVALDSELHREVALKQIQPAYADHPESRARFVLEAEITGGLEHPGIVPVYSLGQDVGGRPYYAMRFIQGDSFKQASDRFHQAGVADRDPGARTLEFQKLLRRFLDICNAIAYAHSRGVLHRDIKPGNVMVGPFGETLVVDWGLAKVVGKEEAAVGEGAMAPLRPPSSSNAPMTRLGAAMGTPQYMSPEQASGQLDQLGPTSDVYSLGATLYYLLTGRTPFPPDTAEKVLARVRRGAFDTPRQVNPMVPPALEAVCLRAMALRPEDRYPNARALGEEIERWLADEPVLSYREPFRVRTRRWARRHRALVTSSAAAALMGALGLAAVTGVLGVKNREIAEKNLTLRSTNRQLDRQQQRAEQGEQQAVNAIKKFRDVISNNSDLKNREEFKALRATLLKEPLAFFESLRNRLEASGDTRPETLSRLAGAVGELGLLTQEIGNLNDAIQAFEEARAICDRLSREQPNETRYRIALAEANSNLGTVQNQIGQADRALSSFRQSESMLDALARDAPEDAAITMSLARVRNGLGLMARSAGRLTDAIADYERSRSALSRLVARQPENQDARYFLALNRMFLSELRLETGHPAEALDAAEEARSTLDALARERPDDSRYPSMLAVALKGLADVHRKTGQVDQALESLRQAIEIGQPLANEHPSNLSLQLDLAGTFSDQGTYLHEAGRPKEAMGSFGEALAICERMAPERLDDVGLHRQIGMLYYNIGLAHTAAYESDEARNAYLQARAIQEKLAQDVLENQQFEVDLSSTLANLGTMEVLTGRSDDAQETLEQARIRYEKLTASNPEVTTHWIGLAKCQGSLALLARGMGRAEESLEANGRALEINRQLAEKHPTEIWVMRDLAAALGDRAITFGSLGRTSEALSAYAEAIAILKPLAAASPGFTEGRAMLAQCHAKRGEIDATNGRFLEAMTEFHRARKLYEGLSHEHPGNLSYQNGLAGTLGCVAVAAIGLGRDDEALDSTQQAIEAFERLSRANPEKPLFRFNIATCYENIGGIMMKRSRTSEAIMALEEAKNILVNLPDDPGNRRELAKVRGNLGYALAQVGQVDAARSSYLQAMALFESLASAQPSDWEARSMRALCRSQLAELEANGDRLAKRLDAAFPADPFAHESP